MASKKHCIRISSTAMSLLLFLTFIMAGCDIRNGFGQPTPSALPTFAPTDTTQSLPDLAIKAVSLEIETVPDDECAAPSGRFWVLIQIDNQGDADAGPFSVQVNGVDQNVPDGLKAGKSVSLWFSEYSPFTTVQVDSNSQIVENNKTNNRLSQELALPTQSPNCVKTPTPMVAIEEPVINLKGHTGKVLSVDFSPDGNLVASGSTDDTLRLWQVNPGRLLRTMHGHPFPILALAFSPNGTFLVTGSTDSLLRTWLVSNARLLTPMAGHAGWVTDLSISPDGKYVVSCAQDFTVRVWRLADGKLVQTIDEGMAKVNSVAFSPDGTTIAWGEADGTVRLRSLSGAWLQVLKNTTYSAASVAFSPSGERLAAGFADGAIRIWQTDNGEFLQTLHAHTDLVSDLDFSPDGKWLVSASFDNTLCIWRFVDGKFQDVPAFILVGHTGPVNSVSFSPKDALIASGSDDATVRLWAVPEE
jgi:WD40 repeat protein